ncbi:MAG: cyclic pyranopterin monophosphate synthase MoaC [archaeon]|nr:cyclic pyranopterin monophosphate synthase MoaC [archaeon]
MKINMVDISSKKDIKRTATARGKIYLKESTIETIRDGKIQKGDIFPVSEIAAINAVKETPHLIPLCHNIPLSKADVDFEVADDHITAKVTVTSTAKTGVEMEALIGANICLLNIWDMVKYLEKDDMGQYPNTRITDIKVTEKKKEEI